MSMFNRTRTNVALVAMVLACQSAASAAQIDIVWDGGTGTWSTAALWTPDQVPSNGGANTVNVFIDNGNATASVVTLNQTATIDNLTIDGNDALVIENGQALVVSVGDEAGTIDNRGVIQLGSTGSATYIRMADGPLTLTGDGTLQLSNNANNWIYRHSAGGALINVDNVIQGAGNIGWNGSPTPIENHNLITANVSTPLSINAAGGVLNAGWLQAADGGTLRLQGGNFDNQDGIVEALADSTVELDASAIINGGLLRTAGTGLINVTGTSSRLNGTADTIEIEGLIRISNSAQLRATGTIENGGVIEIGSTGSHTYLFGEDGPVTFTGGGVIRLSNHSNNWMYRGNAAGSIVNVDNTIEGAGNVGWNGSPTPITNQGTIVATHAENSLLLSASGGVVNTGTLRADGGALLLQHGTITNTGGVIEADGSTVQLSNSVTIAGGSLTTVNDGAFVVSTTNNTLDGSSDPVVSDALIRINNSARLDLRGTIENSGVIEVNSTGGSTYLLVDGPVMLTGGGVIRLSDQSSNWIYRAAAGGSLVNVDHTIEGAGNIGWNGSPTAFENQGTIIATGAQPLKLDASANLANSGLIRVSGAGGVQIGGANFANAGTVDIEATRTLTRTGAYLQTAGLTRVNGTLQSSGLITIQGGALSGAGIVNGAVTNSGTIEPGDGVGLLTINGTLALSPTSDVVIEIGGADSADLLDVNGTAMLSGTLSIELVDDYEPAIGDLFTVMTFNTRAGSFDALQMPCLEGGMIWSIWETATTVMVEVVAVDAEMRVDVNCDCARSHLDVLAFTQALIQPDAFVAGHPGCDLLNADLNEDGLVDGRDVQGFVDAMLAE